MRRRKYAHFVFGAVPVRRSEMLWDPLRLSLGATHIEFALAPGRHYFQASIRGSLRGFAGDASAGTPTMIGAIADTSKGIPSSYLI